MADSDNVAAVVSFLKRVKTQTEIEAIAVDAFAATMDGTKVVSVAFEGGSASSQKFFDAGMLLQACEIAIADLIAVSSGQLSAGSRVVFPAFNQSILET